VNYGTTSSTCITSDTWTLSLFNGASSANSTTIPWDQNSGPVIGVDPEVESFTHVKPRERNRERLKALRKCQMHREAIGESLRLARAPVSPPLLRPSQVVRAPTVPSRAHARVSFRNSVLERRAMPRVES